MPRIQSGKRYAQAAFELALQRNEMEGWQQALGRIAALGNDEEGMALLQNPRAPFEVKKSLLQERLKGVHPLALNLALLLVGKGMFHLAGAIFRQFNEMLDAHRGVERADVVAALPLGEDERAAIARQLGEIVHRNVIIDSRVDPAIIGGFIARIRDTLIDGSIRQRLEALKERLVEDGR